MSTRANVIVKDGYATLYLYRHSDGYPEGVKDTLRTFIDMVNHGKLRRDAMQSAGWLILLGAEEYRTTLGGEGWKVGAYEPTTEIHGDIEYLYVIDLEESPVTCRVLDRDFEKWEQKYKKCPLL